VSKWSRSHLCKSNVTNKCILRRGSLHTCCTFVEAKQTSSWSALQIPRFLATADTRTSPEEALSPLRQTGCAALMTLEPSRSCAGSLDLPTAVGTDNPALRNLVWHLREGNRCIPQWLFDLVSLLQFERQQQLTVDNSALIAIQQSLAQLLAYYYQTLPCTIPDDEIADDRHVAHQRTSEIPRSSAWPAMKSSSCSWCLSRKAC
jgi:hypothetical protein